MNPSQPLLQTLVLLIAMLLLCAASVMDAKTRKLPNSIAAALFLLFPLYAAADPEPWPWLQHLGSFLLVLCAGFGLYANKIAGAGDIKMLSVMALWSGLAFLPHLILITFLSGGVLSLGFALMAMLKRKGKKNAEWIPIRQIQVPYGVAIATGGLCVILMLSHKSLFLA